MKQFIEEYSLAILSAVVALILIVMCTPIGNLVSNEANKIVNEQANRKTVPLTISFNADVGTFEDGSSLYTIYVEKGKSVADNEITELPIPTKDSYSFDGWYTKTTCNGDKIELSTTIEENLEVYACWKYDSSKMTTDKNQDYNGVYNDHLFIKGSDKGVFKVGTVFSWQGYDWMVLQISSQKALIMTKNIYGKTKGPDLSDRTYSNIYTMSSKESSLSKNIDTFGNKLDKSLMTDISLSIGYWGDEYAYTTSNITKKMFALSYSETKSLLDSDELRVATDEAGESACYWTRSGATEIGVDANGNKMQAKYVNNAMAVFNDGSFKNINVSEECGYRPAAYIDLTKINNITIKN